MKYAILILILCSACTNRLQLVKENITPKWAVIKILPSPETLTQADEFMKSYCGQDHYQVASREYQSERYINGWDWALAPIWPFGLNRERQWTYVGFACKKGDGA